MARLAGIAVVGILMLAGCGDSDDASTSPKDRAASACDDYIALLTETQAGDLTLQEALPRVGAVRSEAAVAAAEDSTWDSLVAALDRIIAIMQSGDQSDFPAAGLALQNSCAGAFDLEPPG